MGISRLILLHTRRLRHSRTLPAIRRASKLQPQVVVLHHQMSTRYGVCIITVATRVSSHDPWLSTPLSSLDIQNADTTPRPSRPSATASSRTTAVTVPMIMIAAAKAIRMSQNNNSPRRGLASPTAAALDTTIESTAPADRSATSASKPVSAAASSFLSRRTTGSYSMSPASSSGHGPCTTRDPSLRREPTVRLEDAPAPSRSSAKPRTPHSRVTTLIAHLPRRHESSCHTPTRHFGTMRHSQFRRDIRLSIERLCD